MSPPRLLYCSPVMPALGGNGLAMRAGIVLQALATRYRVSLLVVPLYVSPVSELPEEIAACCQDVALARPDQGWASAIRFADRPFDVVHVFRLALVERLRSWPGDGLSRPTRHLDLDDVESSTRRRIADLYDLNRRPELAAAERAQADRALAAEAAALRDFGRLYVCAEGDRLELEARRPAGAEAHIELLPNALRRPEAVPPAPTDEPFTFLFVGTFGYFPNEDGIITFCRDTLPRLRRMSPGPFRVLIAGTGATPAIQALASIPEVELAGAVPSIADCYARARAMIVPIRAGGGTRIKILEAFAYRRPVVTTTIGAEGIEATPGEHLLLADDPGDFARQCARFVASPSLAARIAENAEARFRAQYSFEALVRRVAKLP